MEERDAARDNILSKIMVAGSNRSVRLYVIQMKVVAAVPLRSSSFVLRFVWLRSLMFASCNLQRGIAILVTYLVTSYFQNS